MGKPMALKLSKRAYRRSIGQAASAVRLLTVLAMLLGILATPIPVVAASRATVIGTVSGTGGSVVAGATVTYTCSSGCTTTSGSTTTDANGQYTFSLSSSAASGTPLNVVLT